MTISRKALQITTISNVKPTIPFLMVSFLPAEWVETSPVLLYPKIGPIRLSPKNQSRFRLFSYTHLNDS
jgi:hypothetical protein